MKQKKTPLILGIETSCDETSVAVYCEQKTDNPVDNVLSNVTFSQIDLHKKFGGVVPEIASRGQLEKINIITQEALDTANITLDDIDVVAVSYKPGLPGSLLVGICFAKSIAAAKQKKLIGVNHLEAHAYSSFLEHNVPFKHICLTASGGHTSLCLMKNFGNYDIIGYTIDDAAGEAFDKIAKLLRLPYPGGPEIEKLAREVDFQDFFSYPRGKLKNLNFSFSGLKTAVLYDLVERGAYDMAAKKLLDNSLQLKQKVASSLLVCIADIFEQRLKRACKQHPDISSISLVGGVACNKYLRRRLQTFCDNNNLKFFTPSPKFCTDNAAMIAFVGNYKTKAGEFSDLYLDIF